MSAPLDPSLAAFLAGLKSRGVQLGLDRMRALLAAAGDPHEDIPAIHIAGTNGKGSVAAMVESILRQAGWRTGLYTSPHLVRFTERIQVDRVPIAASEFEGNIRELRALTEKLVARRGDDAMPSYFEFMTALAFLHFVRAGCDAVVIEVGMGGRLDATNVVRPEVSAITSIGMDHMEFLGHTLEAIAAEKAGIVKPRTPVVIGRLPAAAERVVRAVASQQEAPVVSVFENYGDDIGRYPITNLPGDCQRVNAATAALIARTLDGGWRLNDATITAGLGNVNWPARWQRLRISGRTVIVDGAHNEEGARTLAQNLTALGRVGPKPIVVVGVLGVARARPILAAVAEHAAEIRLVMAKQRRACTHDELSALIPTEFTGPVVRTSLEEIFPRAGTCLPTVPRSQPVVITGSVYLAGEALAHIDPTLGPVEYELQDF